jgi:dihydrodipicolinate synthase/N-acetylneuraminate lyase
MDRRTRIANLLPGGAGLLWCPLLTHYCLREGRVAVDRRRMAAHMRSLGPYTDRFLLASSAGDGWDLDTSQFNDLLTFARHEAYWAPTARFFVAALGRTTLDVVRRGQTIRARLGDRQAFGLAGITVCPPVTPDATQEEIRAHYRRVVREVGLPVAVYHLPQVTHCSIEPDTLAAIVAEHESVIAFKDSSGTDAVATSGADLNGSLLLRGAEGEYAESLKAGGGPYDALLLGSANVLGYSLRNILDMTVSGETDLARRHAAKLSELIGRLLDVVGGFRTGNLSSNLNRAVDHLLAHGMHWREVEPPMLFDGSRLPRAIVERVATIYDAEAGIPERGYFVHREAVAG